MLVYLVRRLFWCAVAFVAVTVATFVIFFLVPNDPARSLAGTDDPATILRARHFLALDQPIYVQYAHLMRRIVIDHDLGQSFSSRLSVNETIARAAPVTLSLVAGGLVLWLIISIVIGLTGAMRPGSLSDRLGMAFVLTGVSVHPIFLGLVLSYLFGYRLHWAPLTGYCTFAAHDNSLCGGAVVWFTHMVLPWLTFATLYAALYARMIRACVLEKLDEDWVRTAMAKGAPMSRVMRRHVLPNALLPVLTMLGTDLGVALGGSIFVEQVFSLPGLGRMAAGAARGRDLPTTMGIVIWASVAVILLTLLVDLLYAWLDPRVRLGRQAA